MYASAQKKKNQIFRLNDDVGNWHDCDHGLGEVIGNYYEQLFQSNDVVCDEILDSIGPRISR